VKYDPINKEVYTDKGEFVKRLFCPYKINWDQLAVTSGNNRTCTTCNHLIIDTAYVSDDELLQMLQQNPNTCLKLELNQPNLTVIVNGKTGKSL
jgi:hypothetical protein